jgi:hypothetical protein
MKSNLKNDKSVKDVLHFPRLDTVVRVENLLRDAQEPLSKNEIDRRLTKKIMRSTLNVILNYLEESGKIGITKKGFIWIWHEDITKKLKERLKKSIQVA